MSEPYRQGDVLIVPIDKIPEEAHCIRREDQVVKGKGIVLAEGEATGHHHVIKDRGARLYAPNYFRTGRRFVKVFKCGAKVTHEEHDPISLPPGAYEIKRQREYVPPASASAPARTARVYD